MDSPSAQLVEASMLDFGGPPSSPFVAEIETQSRHTSTYTKSATETLIVEEENTTYSSTRSPNLTMTETYDLSADKENVPQHQDSLIQMKPSPAKPATAAPESTRSSPFIKRDQERSTGSDDSSLMPPPPSARKMAVSPQKTPLRSSRSGANTPKSFRRNVSNGHRTPSLTNASFQAGLDARNAMMPTEDTANVDDTCFSTFSAIPDMTAFAKLGQSPTKHLDDLRTPRSDYDATPRASRKRSSPSRSPSPTPRRLKTPVPDNTTTNFLIDFTQQMQDAGSMRPGSPIKSATESNLLQYMNSQRSPNKRSSKAGFATPSKPNNLMNLLDFELPPAPTPRSIPTITVRELESLKSSYLSQISGLKATLSGREAEVESLKKAVGDAEHRVGEAQEALREEKSKREHLEGVKADWERRGREFETVLRSVKEEVLKSEAEAEEKNRRLEDAEKRVSDAETRATKAEERFADALAARAGAAEDGDGGGVEEQVQRLVAAQIDSKIEAVSRELHAVYKEKHERKVGTLKKSYEARNEKKTAELQARVADLERHCEELQAARDATFSGPQAVGDTSMAVSDNADLKAQLEEQKAALARLASEVEASQSQQEQLLRELQQERIEKGDLVAAVDEMLALQSEAPPTPAGARAVSVVEDFRKSITGARPPSALRGPGPESRIGRAAAPGVLSRTGSNAGGVGKSRMLANIERMGRSGSGNAGGGAE